MPDQPIVPPGYADALVRLDAARDVADWLQVLGDIEEMASRAIGQRSGARHHEAAAEIRRLRSLIRHRPMVAGDLGLDARTVHWVWSWSDVRDSAVGP